MLPSSNDLTYFLEVAHTLNLSRAAERLGIAQPSLTLSIQRLEHLMGVSLLDRGKKGVTLTRAGKTLRTHARALLDQWSQLKSETLSSLEGMQGIVRLGAHSAVAQYTLQHFVPQLLEKNPQLELVLKHDLSRRIAEQIVQREIDLGIVVNPIRHPDLVIIPLMKDEVTFWKSTQTSPLLDPENADAVLIGDPDLLQTQALLQQTKKKNWKLRRFLTSPHLEVILSLTETGAGIGILPGCVAALATRPIKKIPGAPRFSDEICLVYRAESRKISTIQAVADAAIRALKK